jgi:hypothetical protein
MARAEMREARGDLITSVILLGITATGFWSLNTNPDIGIDFGADPGPGLIPNLLLWGLGLCGLGMFGGAVVQLLWARNRKAATPVVSEGWGVFLVPVGFTVTLVAYVEAMLSFGFLQATTGFSILWVMLIGYQDHRRFTFRSLVVYLLEALAISGVIYVIFAKLIQVPLP